MLYSTECCFSVKPLLFAISVCKLLKLLNLNCKLSTYFCQHTLSMSSIERLGIRGIRSFSPYDEETIDFAKPLTLILGQNGAGKTVSHSL